MADGPLNDTLQRVALGHRLLKITAQDELEAQPLTGPSHPTRNPNAMAAPASGSLRMRASITALNLPRSLVCLRVKPARCRTRPLFCARGSSGARIASSTCWDRSPSLYGTLAPSGSSWRATTPATVRSTTARPQNTLPSPPRRGRSARVPGVSSELDERQLARDLIGLPPEYPSTRFRDVRQLAPGHCLVVTRDGAVDRRYWKIDSLAPIRFARDEDYVEAFLEIFDEAVRCRLRTTGAIATELSAGLDSGSVAATAARLLGNRRHYADCLHGSSLPWLLRDCAPASDCR